MSVEAAESFTKALTLVPGLGVRPIAAYYLEKMGKPVPPPAKSVRAAGAAVSTTVDALKGDILTAPVIGQPAPRRPSPRRKKPRLTVGTRERQAGCTGSRRSRCRPLPRRAGRRLCNAEPRLITATASRGGAYPGTGPSSDHRGGDRRDRRKDSPFRARHRAARRSG